MSDPKSMSYIGLAPCGCTRVAVVDCPDSKDLTAREVAKIIRRGYELRHLPSAEVRTRQWTCDAHRAEQKEKEAKRKAREEKRVAHPVTLPPRHPRTGRFMREYQMEMPF